MKIGIIRGNLKKLKGGTDRMARRRMDILNMLFAISAIVAGIAVGNGLIVGSLTPTIAGFLIPGGVLWGWLVVGAGILTGLKMFGMKIPGL